MVRSSIQPSLKVIGAVCAGLLCAFALALSPASAEPRIALVIGNSQYQGDMPVLPNPEKDAKLMARTLRDLGFDVIDKENATQADLKQAISDFGNRLAAAGRDATGFFFYAGHGIQVDGENYLIPVDAKLQKEADADLNAVKVSSVQSQMTYADNAVNIIVLDACRDNPLKGSSRGLKRGLAEIDAVNGMFVAYSTSPGETAADGDGANSPYTAALAQTLKEPGVSIGDAFQEVRTKVLAETGNTQRPWDSSSLTGRFYFKPADASQQVATAQPAATTPPPPAAPAADASADEVQYEKMYWDSVKDSNDADALNLYLAKYPNGIYVDLANYKLQQLKGTQVASADTAPAQGASAARGAVSHDDTPATPPQQQTSLAPQVSIVALSQTLYAQGDGRVRAAPDGKGQLITSFPQNAQVNATGRTTDGRWWRIDLGNGQVGYMHRSVVSDQPVQTASVPQQQPAMAPQQTASDANSIVMMQGGQPTQSNNPNVGVSPAQAQQMVDAAQNPSSMGSQVMGGALSALGQMIAGGSQPIPQPTSDDRMGFAAYNHAIMVRGGAVILDAAGNGSPIAQVTQPRQMTASARTSNGSWYQVVLPNGNIGYLAGNWVQR